MSEPKNFDWKAWAKKLIDRFNRGEQVNDYALRMAREAIAEIPTHTEARAA